MSDTGTDIVAGEPVVATPVAGVPVASDDLVNTKAEIETMKKSLLEAQQKITELSTENSTFVQRIDELETKGDEVSANKPANTSNLDSVIRLAQSDPALAIEQLVRMTEQAKTDTERSILIKVQQQMESRLNDATFIQEAREILKKEDIGEWENEIAAVARLKMNSRRIPLRKAVEETIKEFKQKVIAKSKQNRTPSADSPLPSGATPTSGANAPPVVPPAETPVETREGYVTRRENERLKRIRFA